MTEAPDRTIEPLLKSVGIVLEKAGILRRTITEVPGRNALDLLYEDKHAIIGVAAFESVHDLMDGWLDAQDALTRIISGVIPSTNSKAWDGYLVAMTDRVPRTSEAVALAAIRSNTRRLRKLVITGDDLGQGIIALRNGVRRSLAPLLPLALPPTDAAADSIAGLPDRISVPGLTPDDIRSVVNAFEAGLPPLQALHSRVTDGGTT